MERILVENGLVMDRGRATPRSILIEGDTIAALPPPGEAVAARRINASGRLVMPGLINAHTHSHGGLAKGSGDRWSLELLLNAGPWLAGDRSEEDLYLSAALGAVEMLRKGCTACFDLTLQLPFPTPDGLRAVGQAYMDLGLRAVVAPMVADRGFWQAISGLEEGLPDDLRALAGTMRAAEADAVLDAIRRAALGWPFPTDRVRLGVAPTIPLHCTDPFLRGCHRLSAEFGLPLQTHLAESRHQCTAAHRRWGEGLVPHLARLGVLDRQFSAAHGVWLESGDLDRIAEAGGGVAHNPGSNLRLGSGIADIRPMLARGMNVGVGTDGSASSDHQNMFEATRLAAIVSRVLGRDTDEWISAAEALHAATEGSAAVLGWAGAIGRIAPGFKADLVFLDLDHPNLVPLNDPLNQLVHGEDGSAVRDVMVGGTWVVRDRAVLGVDWPALASKAREAAARLRRSTAPARLLAERLEPYVEKFCRGLRGAPHPPRMVPIGDFI
jgi:guanine deaminase